MLCVPPATMVACDYDIRYANQRYWLYIIDQTLCTPHPPHTIYNIDIFELARPLLTQWQIDGIRFIRTHTHARRAYMSQCMPFMGKAIYIFFTCAVLGCSRLRATYERHTHYSHIQMENENCHDFVWERTEKKKRNLTQSTRERGGEGRKWCCECDG